MYQGKGEQKLLLLLFVLIIVVGTGMIIWQKINNQNIITETFEVEEDILINDYLEEEEEKEKWIIVHIAGEINNPGVYQLKEDSRVIDAVKIAGGETEIADLDNLNLAAPIFDGDKIYVPSILEEISQSNNKHNFNNTVDKININKATSEELQKIPGIGPSKAGSIIDYRDQIGKFTEIEQLLEVSGIGEKTLEKIKDKITFR